MLLGDTKQERPMESVKEEDKIKQTRPMESVKEKRHGEYQRKETREQAMESADEERGGSKRERPIESAEEVYQLCFLLHTCPHFRFQGTTE